MLRLCLIYWGRISGTLAHQEMILVRHPFSNQHFEPKIFSETTEKNDGFQSCNKRLTSERRQGERVLEQGGSRLTQICSTIDVKQVCLQLCPAGKTARCWKRNCRDERTDHTRNRHEITVEITRENHIKNTKCFSVYLPWSFQKVSNTKQKWLRSDNLIKH